MFFSASACGPRTKIPSRGARFRSPPQFDDLLDAVVGRKNAQEHAIVLSVNEILQIQALDRSQPGLLLKPGCCGTKTHHYKRHGTITLFAALDVLEGKVIGRCMQCHRYQEFIRFLNAIEGEDPGQQDPRHPR